MKLVYLLFAQLGGGIKDYNGDTVLFCTPYVNGQQDYNDWIFESDWTFGRLFLSTG